MQSQPKDLHRGFSLKIKFPDYLSSRRLSQGRIPAQTGEGTQGRKPVFLLGLSGPQALYPPLTNLLPRDVCAMGPCQCSLCICVEGGVCVCMRERTHTRAQGSISKKRNWEPPNNVRTVSSYPSVVSIDWGSLCPGSGSISDSGPPLPSWTPSC